MIPRDFPRRMEVAFPAIVGPFEVAGRGHFLMWERRGSSTARSARFAGISWHNRGNGPTGNVRVSEGSGSRASEVAAKEVERIVAAANEAAEQIRAEATYVEEHARRRGEQDAERVRADARKEAQQEVEQSRKEALLFSQDARREAELMIADAKREGNPGARAD